MIDLAFKYSTEINRLYLKNSINHKGFKFFNLSEWTEYTLDIKQDAWSDIQYVILDEYKSPIAYMYAKIDRYIKKASQIGLISLAEKPDSRIIKGALEFIDRVLFGELKLRKINFDAVKENPANRIYQKYINTHDTARVLGVYKDDCLLLDNKYHDIITYEFMNPNNSEWRFIS